MAQPSEASSAFEIKFTSGEVSAWGGMALMKRMLDSMNFCTAASQWDLPEPGSNRETSARASDRQLLESIWCEPVILRTSTSLDWTAHFLLEVRGYNPNKRGRLSHHPLFRMIHQENWE